MYFIFLTKRALGMKQTKEASIIITKSHDEVIKVKFPWSPQELDNVRTLKGRKYNPKDKSWIAFLTNDNVKSLIHWKYILSPELTEWYKQQQVKKQNKKTDIKIDGLKCNLFNYQKEGVLFIENKQGRALIADEMGLGKTVQVLAWCQMHLDLIPVIIICPASLKENWNREARKWTEDIKPLVVSGTTPKTLIRANTIIINYDILHYWVNFLIQLKPKVVIMDEAHYIKNNSAKRTKAAKKLAKVVPHRLFLTGTPIESKPIEMWNTISLVNPTLFESRWKFAQRYCDPKHNGFGWDFNGTSNAGELNKILTESIMIRRLKYDVLTELPEKIYSNLPIQIDNEKEYRQAEEDFISFIKSKTEKEITDKIPNELKAIIEINKKELEFTKQTEADKADAGGVLYQIEILKQLVAKGKLNSLIQWIEDFIESGQKLVIFATHKFVIAELMNHFGVLAVKIDGSIAVNKRQGIVDEFQTNKRIKLFVGNIKAAGVGITLTAASNILFTEYPWKPGELSQATDRCHRIGQKYPVNIYFSAGINTIDERILNLLDKKQKVVNAVLDGQDISEASMLDEIIKSYM